MASVLAYFFHPWSNEIYNLTNSVRKIAPDKKIRVGDFSDSTKAC
jgi:hypothetical protein